MLYEMRTVVNILNTFIKFHGFMNKDFFQSGCLCSIYLAYFSIIVPGTILGLSGIQRDL